MDAAFRLSVSAGISGFTYNGITLQRFATWLVEIWHVIVLVALAQAFGMLRPLGPIFSRPSIWRPVQGWLRSGALFQFRTGRAAAVFFLVALLAGALVLLLYLFDKLIRGRIAMLIWNALGAYNYAGRRTWLFAAFLVAMFITVLSGSLKKGRGR